MYIIFSLLIILLSSGPAVFAYDMELGGRAHKSTRYKRLSREGQIDVDTREAPVLHWQSLQRRQNESGSTTSIETAAATSDTSSTITSASSDITSSATSTSTGAEYTSSSTPTTTSSTIPSVTVITTPLPSPFDTSLGSNFTSQACPNFFNTFLSNSTFKSCVPVSLLLQNSNSFFRAERDPALLSETLDAACNAPMAFCTPLLQEIASELISSSNCGTEYQEQNPFVLQAYNGLMAYEPVYRATCLKDAQTGTYCFSEAITNMTAPSDPYPYYTALGLALPKGSRPTCSLCLQQTMEIFATYASSSSQPLSQTYLSCAQQVDQGCGSSFANITVAAVSTSGASSLRQSTAIGYPIALLAALTVLI